MKKRLLALALAVVLYATMLPAHAASVGLSGERAQMPVTDSSPHSAPATDVSAQLSDSTSPTSGTCGTGATWTLDSSGLLHISGTGDMAHYTSSKHAPWFDYQSQITSVQVDGVSTIGNYAFYGLSKLTSVSMADSVIKIGDNAFENCQALTDVTLSNRISAIPWKGFLSCTALTAIALPDSVTTVGGYAFQGCSRLKTLTVGPNLNLVGERAFNNCGGIKDVFYPGADRTGINISSSGNGNTALTDAYWHYGFNGGPLVELSVKSSEKGTLLMSQYAYPGETVTIAPAPAPGYRFTNATVSAGTLDGLQYTAPADNPPQDRHLYRHLRAPLPRPHHHRQRRMRRPSHLGPVRRRILAHLRPG